MTEEFAKEVFDMDMERVVDRTTAHHKYPYDVDVRSPSAKKKFWIYWGSHNNIEKARTMIQRHLKKALGDDAQARIVDAKTGKILEVFP